MNCTKCGSNLPENSMFCPGCGSAVQTAPPQNPVYEQPVQQSTGQPMYQQPVQQQPAGQPMYQQPYPTTPKKKSKAPWIALGVSLFLLIAIIAIVIILLVSCGSDANSSPEKLVTGFLEAISDNEAEDCLDTLYPVTLQMEGGNSYNVYNTLRTMVLSSLDATSVSFTNIAITDSEKMDAENLKEGNQALSSYSNYIPMSAGFYVKGSALATINVVEQKTIGWEATIVLADGDYYLIDFEIDYAD